MLIDFNNMQEREIEHLDGGEGAIPAKMFMNEYGKVIVSRIPPKCSIGLHSHKSSNDIKVVRNDPAILYRCYSNRTHTVIRPIRCFNVKYDVDCHFTSLPIR